MACWAEGLFESAGVPLFPHDDAKAVLWASQVEMLVSSLLFLWKARWENQGHITTFWQTCFVFEVLALRQHLYDSVLLMSIALVGLYMTYFVGIYTEFTKIEEVRLPPFASKKSDEKAVARLGGWLGKQICERVQNKALRMLIIAVMYCVGLAFSFFMLYAFFVSEVDDLRNTQTFKNSITNTTVVNGTTVVDFNIHALTPLLLVGIVASGLSMVPSLLVEAGSLPGLFFDLWNFKKASRSYQTDVFDVCELDEDKDGPGKDLKSQMLAAGKVEDFTLVLPCYLPNEEEILDDVFEHYLKELKKLAMYEGDVFGAESLCRKQILVVWNKPEKWTPKASFEDEMRAWIAKFKENQILLVVHEVLGSTSKCDNLNEACENLFDPEKEGNIHTTMCCLNDADTMLDWSCIVRGSIHITNGYHIAQSMNSHCANDANGTPDGEVPGTKTCHPYGMLITIGDATKPPNMSTQTTFNHAPFNGRGGFWNTDAVRKVGFDHRTVGEDHCAGYRGCAYFGMKGILDMNMLCQEQEPPNCSALTKQRIRWETAALQMRRTFSWIIRSPHYSRFETFILLWSQLSQNCNMPFQSLPFSVATALPLILIKGWVSIYAFGPAKDHHFCAERECVWSFHVTNPVTGHPWIVALPLPLVIFVWVGIFFSAVTAVDYCIRVLSSRYRPTWRFLCYYAFLRGLFVVPYFVYIQYWAMYDYCWGGAKFIATERSPTSKGPTPKLDAHTLSEPLVER